MRCMMRTTQQAEQVEILLPFEAAKYLRISERTLFTLTKTGAIPCSRVGRNKRYSRSTLKAFIESGAVAPLTAHARK
jgi:excisionase family DNA binding protein